MNSSVRIKELNDELKALKSTFEMSAYNLVIYTYEIDVTALIGVQFTVTFTTDDGINAIAAIENAYARRVPFNGGARWKVDRALAITLKVHSMQKGELSITW